MERHLMNFCLQSNGFLRGYKNFHTHYSNKQMRYRTNMQEPIMRFCSFLGTDHRKRFIINTDSLNHHEKNLRFLDTILPSRKQFRLKQTHSRLRETQEKLKRTQQKLKDSKQKIIQDIRETKVMMKERMENIIERENIWTVPNILCITRIIFSPYLGYLIILSDFNFALGLLAVAGVTDALDGWIARTWKSQSSKLGSFLDPMADKVLIATLFVSLTYVDLIPIALTTLIVLRDIALVSAGCYIRYKSLPPPRTFRRYFDASHATAQLAPTSISKFNTLMQLTLVACTLGAPVFGYVDHAALHGLWYLTAGTTIVSAMSYIFFKGTYRLLRNQNRKRN